MEMNRYRFQDAVEDKENIVFRETRQSARAKNRHPHHHFRPMGDHLPFYPEESPPPSVHTWTPSSSASKTKKKKKEKKKKAKKESTELRRSGARNSPSPPSSEDEGYPEKPQPPRMADEDTVFSCLTCFKRFDNVFDLQLHVKTHKVYPCAFCGSEYSDHRALRMHLFSHPAGPEESGSSH